MISQVTLILEKYKTIRVINLTKKLGLFLQFIYLI
jgi:hypothetical protein